VVEKILASVGLPKGYAWCAAMIKYCLDGAGIRTGITGWAPSAVPFSRRVWYAGKKVKRLPTVADAFGIYFPHHKRVAHVGFVDRWDTGTPYCVTVEGNTNGAGARDGNGTYEKTRLKSQIHIVVDWID